MAASWRRTNDGWEKLENWNLRSSVRGERPIFVELHPVIVALLELFLALGALAVLNPTDTTEAGAAKPRRHS